VVQIVGIGSTEATTESTSGKILQQESSTSSAFLIPLVLRLDAVYLVMLGCGEESIAIHVGCGTAL